MLSVFSSLAKIVSRRSRSRVLVATFALYFMHAVRVNIFNRRKR